MNISAFEISDKDMDIQRKKLLGYFSVAVISILVVWFVFGSANDSGDFEKKTIVLTNSTGEQIEMTVEIAETEEEKKQGLMDRDSLCEYCGMLFVYEEDVHIGFWMKDTQIPLSIAFISENGTIIEIQQMEPETTDLHKPAEQYRYALEVNQGFFEENQVNPGNVVSIPEKYK